MLSADSGATLVCAATSNLIWPTSKASEPAFWSPDKTALWSSLLSLSFTV